MSELVKNIIAKRIKNSQYFVPDEVIITGHELGYLSPEDIDVTNMPKNAVMDCKNFDFPPGGDTPRQPYNLYADFSALLPAKYEIVRFCEKQFVSGTGQVKRVVIIAALNPDSTTPKLKIFVNSYWLPLKDYDNSSKYDPYTSPVWEDGFYEITARYKHNDVGIQYLIVDELIGDTRYQIKVIANGTTEQIFGNKRRDYFKGWYVINGDDVVGIVTASFTPSGAYTGTYFKINLEDGAVLTNQEVGLCRFPVNDFNKDNWANITDIRFESEFPNAVRIYSGYESRPLILTFISERQYFGGAFAGEPGYEPTSHSGWLTPQGIPSFSTQKIFKVRCKERSSTQFYTVIKFAWSVNEGAGFGTETDMPLIISPGLGGLFDALQEVTLGISVRLRGNWWNFAIGHYATIQVDTGLSASWDGFWLGYDIPDVPFKKFYKYKDGNVSELSKNDIGRELGLRYDIDTIPIETGTLTEKIYSFAVELDGYQTIFLKQVFVPKFPDAVPTPYHDYLESYVYFSPAFDRRITGHLLYFAEDPDYKIAIGSSADYELPETTRFNDMKRGYYPISKMGAVVSNKSWKVLIINSTEDALELSATGEKLGVDRLNNPYWYSVVQKAKYAFRAGDNVIAVNLANDTANFDKDTQAPNMNGNESICVSQLQQGANAASVMSTKRVRQITKGFPLLAGVWMTENQFMLFTEVESYWFDITDEETLTMRKIAIFDGKGLVNADAVISAREIVASQAGPLTAPMTSLFKGIYFASSTSIFAVVENKLVNLLEDRWEREYKQIEDKTDIRAGFRSNAGDVYFSIPELGEIRVWNIARKHWMIYQFPDTVKYFNQEQDGELFFHTANKIYKTEPIGTEITKDKETDKIEWSFSQYLNHGNSQLMKILDGLEMTYELEGTATAKVHIKVEAADERVASGLNTVFEEDITIRDSSHPEQFYDKRGYKVRDRGQWYKITMSSTTDTDTQTFRLLMLKLKAYFTRGSLTRE